MGTPQRKNVNFNAFHSGFQHVCVPKAVVAQAAKRPDAVAVASGTRVLTYHELDCQASRLARHLRLLGVGADVLVGLCLPRSLDMAAAALGILKSGGAYVPMDPAYPVDRLAYMLEDAQAPVLVTNASLAQRVPHAKCRIVDIDSPELAEGPGHLPRMDVLPGDLAYVIYTSGSTGRPKGVEITHANLANLVGWHRAAFSIAPEDRASHLAGLGFDAAVWELWPYLAAGASVHFADEISRNSAELLRDWLVSQRITVGFVPTPLAEQILPLEWPHGTALRIMLTGGDALHHYAPASLPFALINNYGPTECTVVAASGPVSSDARPDTLPDTFPPIGAPISNTTIHLLDDRLNPVSDGIVGEIYIGGAGVARGYHNRPSLTAERFIRDPFSEDSGARLYRTGDLGRRLPGGQFAFMGRADDQIKIRGYRIEPKEIVAVLNAHPGVRDSLVIARDHGGEKRLIAYVVLDSGASLTHTEARDFLRKRLPEYMLPAVFMRLSSFPVTANGKIDTAALPEPGVSNTLSSEAAETPSTALETQIAAIVTELLGLDEIGREDNFFLLGGHSLLGAQLIARLRDSFHVEITLRSLFAAPTVAELSSEVEHLSAKPAQPPESVPSCAAAEI